MNKMIIDAELMYFWPLGVQWPKMKKWNNYIYRVLVDLNELIGKNPNKI
jgi:hypothetical protein